ncbi:MAG: hypothetical protein IT243_06080 [Bacteroidia bacterium]|nr:hypothetical protein [Bacteroidia bacterium]
MCNCGANKKSFRQSVIQVGTILPHLKYIHCAYQDQFEMLFGKLGINANESNLPLLAALYESGGDKRGDLKINGNPYSFSIEDILSQIDTSKPSKNNCNI